MTATYKREEFERRGHGFKRICQQFALVVRHQRIGITVYDPEQRIARSHIRERVRPPDFCGVLRQLNCAAHPP